MSKYPDSQKGVLQHQHNKIEVRYVTSRYWDEKQLSTKKKGRKETPPLSSSNTRGGSKKRKVGRSVLSPTF